MDKRKLTPERSQEKNRVNQSAMSTQEEFTLKTEINVPFGVLIVPPLKSPILGGKIGLFGPLFQRARLIWALE